jgi:L-amino acid N-acyltransferase YncA
MRLRPMTPADWPAVRGIFEEGIASGLATFESVAPDWPAWDGGHLPFGRIVAEEQVAEDRAAEVAGWAAISPTSTRRVYRGVAEVSVYVAERWRRQGVGCMLLEELVRQSEANGIWMLQAGIFPENEPSVRLHVGCGFRLVGRRLRIGQLNDEWRDTLLLERRSTEVGVG